MTDRTSGPVRAVSLPVGTVLAAMLAVGATAPAAAAAPKTVSAATSKGTVYLVQGVDAATMALGVDGRQVAASAKAKTIVGPLRLAAGKHVLTARTTDGKTSVAATFTVRQGGSMDAVVHRQVDPDADPVVTTYRNDLSAVRAGSGRLVVAHTAAVGPADIRVKGKVLFSNVASGESLSLTVPKGTYPADIVPTGTDGPAVYGPARLQVADGALTRVFAIGVAATKSMDAVVQVLPLATRGSGAMPGRVDAGTGGQAVPLIRAAAARNVAAAAPVVAGASSRAAGHEPVGGLSRGGGAGGGMVLAGLVLSLVTGLAAAATGRRRPRAHRAR